MIRFIISRLIQTVIALFILITLVFFLVRLSGDPVYMMVSSQATPEYIAELRAKLGLDKPMTTQYAIYVKNLLKGDLGKSFNRDRPVMDMYKERIGNTLSIAVPAMILGFVIAFILGVTSAVKRATLFDNSMQVLTAIGIATPPFFLALIMVLVFSTKLNWLPPASYGEFHINQLIMPIVIDAIFIVPIMLTIIRSSMLQVLDSEYIKLARIKGLSEKKVIWKHTLRNAMIAPLTSMGMILSGLVAGSVIVENFFTIPGIGQMAIAAFTGRDFIIVQAFVLIMGTILLLMMLLVDIMYAVVDPQIRYQSM
jgi:peptide/nickel transport system permease protein